jgi:hypothetical protein
MSRRLFVKAKACSPDGTKQRMTIFFYHHTVPTGQKNKIFNRLMQEIDAMVYQLYGLTAEEIKIVEGK